MGAYPRTAETQRLVLRQFRQSDLDAYTSLLTEPEVARWFRIDSSFTRNDAWRHMAMLVGHWDLHGYGRFAVDLKSSGALIGRVGLWYPEGWPEIECGWVIHPSQWGHGYATEAAAETLRLGFASLGLTHIISLIHPDNARSARVAEKLGGRIESTWIDFQGKEALVYGYALSQSRHARAGEVSAMATDNAGRNGRARSGEEDLDAERPAGDAR